MAISFVSARSAAWSAVTGTTSAASTAFTPGAGNTLLIWASIFNDAVAPITVTGTSGTFTIDNPPGQWSDTEADGYATASQVGASAVSQTVTIGAGGITELFGHWLELSGVGSVTQLTPGAYNTTAPGNGPGAIVGPTVTLPVGSWLIGRCSAEDTTEVLSVDSSDGGTQLHSANDDHAQLTLCIGRWAGTGSPMTGKFTAATGANKYTTLWSVVNPPSATGSAAIAEGHDTVAAAGSSSTSGSAAVAEGADAVSAAGTAASGGTGGGAATEGPDSAAGVGTAGASGSASITEAHDAVSAGGSPLLVGSGAATEGADSAYGLGAAASPKVFPLTVAAGGRYYQDANGNPFPTHGFAPWCIQILQPSDWQSLISNYVGYGFNTMELSALLPSNSFNGTNTATSFGGYLPFLKDLTGAAWTGDRSATDPDLTTPNEPYWRVLDAVLDYCLSLGVKVHMFPCYAGYQGEVLQGFIQSLTNNGSTKAQAFGAWLANRWKGFPNLVWMLGGDLGSGDWGIGQLTVEHALLTGLQSVSGALSTDYSAEWTDPDNGTNPDSTLNSALTFNGAYSSSFGTSGQIPNVNALCRSAWASTPTKPAFMVEQSYDQAGSDGTSSNLNATQPCRRFGWWAKLSSINGYTTSNDYVWPCIPATYASHLATQTTQDLARLHAFFATVQWWRLIPEGQSGVGTLIIAGQGTIDTTNFIAASITAAGDLLIAYFSPAATQTATVDSTKMSGAYRARWFDPTNATFTAIGTFPNTGTQTFAVPGANNQGSFSDFALVLDVPGTGAVIEAHDAVQGSGGASTGGSAAVAEGADSASGAGSAAFGAIGFAAVNEAADPVSASGSTSTAGSAAVAESADAAVGVGIAGVPGSAAITEGNDSALGAGSQSLQGAASIAESADPVTGFGSGQAAFRRPSRLRTFRVPYSLRSSVTLH